MCVPHAADEANARVIPSNIDLALEQTFEDEVDIVVLWLLPCLHGSDDFRDTEDDATFGACGTTYNLIDGDVAESLGYADALHLGECDLKLS